MSESETNEQKVTRLVGELREALMAEPIGRANSLANTKLDECEQWHEHSVRFRNRK